MANINQQWRKFIALGCSHGHLADKSSLKAVLKFAEAYKPHTRIHLGDYVDTAAFRSGARGSKDESVGLESDIADGVRFLRDYRPDILFNGNHDIRLWENAEHHNAIVSECARSLIRQIEATLPKKCQFISAYDVRKAVVMLGDTAFLHGFFYNEMAIRDHAEHFGKCVIAHLHTVGSMRGRRSDKPNGYCVGFLGDEELFHYASRRRATARWSQGFAYGEYSDKECVVHLVEKPKDSAWRMPL